MGILQNITSYLAEKADKSISLEQATSSQVKIPRKIFENSRAEYAIQVVLDAI